MLFIKNCPVCEATDFSPFLTCKDHTVSKENFQIVSCNSCRFKFTNPIPDPKDLGRYYKSEDYISHSNTKKGIVSRLYHLVRNYTLKQKEQILLKHVSRGTLLDYGCGTGMFLHAGIVLDAGFGSDTNPVDVAANGGIEPDAGARSIAESLGVPVYSDLSQLPNSTNDKFDAISLWHVLEHVVDLKGTLGFFKSRLSPDGLMAIAVPNYRSFDASHYGVNWAAYDVPRHLYHFDLESVIQLMDRSGFKLVETLPMKFDSFYVSMLSEKYQSGKVNLLKAFFTGLRSNQKAKGPTGYSSVIYLFKHK